MASTVAVRAPSSAKKAPIVAAGPAPHPAQPASPAALLSHNHVQPAWPHAIPVQSEAKTLNSPEQAEPGIALPIQRKLAIGGTSDPLEDEADPIAERVMSIRTPYPVESGIANAPHRVQRQCSCGGTCSKCKGEVRDEDQGELQRKPVASTNVRETNAPPIVHQVLRSPGQALDSATRAFMEPRFGYDFSGVRVHTDRRAAESAESIHALAYTAGQDIVFSHNTYAPFTHQGRELLGHELAHTIQQRGSGGVPPSPAPDGIFESSADAAGRAVANGQSISADFPACGFGLARSPATPEVLNDEDLVRAIQETSDRLKQASYPGRDSDVGWMAQLKAEAARRASFKQPPAITPPKPAAAPKPPLRDPAADRAAAVADAEAAAAQIDQDLKAEDDDEPLVTPMAISSTKSTVKPAATVSADRARQKTPDPAMARFLPGGFKDEDIYKDSDAEMKRIDERIARDREIAKAPYNDRLQTVRIKLQAKSSYSYSRNEAFSHMTGAEVWSEGMADGLFIESEKQSVYEDQKSHQQFINEKMAEDASNARAKSESDRYQAWVAQGEQFSSPQTIIQPFVVAAAAPELVAAAYFGTQTGAMAGETYNSCVHGTKEECAAAAAKLAAQIALERATKGRSGEAPTRSGGKPPPPEDLTFPRGTDVTNASAFPPPKLPTPVRETKLEQAAARPRDATPAPPEAGVETPGAPQPEAEPVTTDPELKPYVNNNPKATLPEIETGTFLDTRAQAGKLKGVSRVEGAPELKVRSGDYRFVRPDGTKIRADLVEPRTTNTSSIVTSIFKKSGQAEVAVVRLGEGTSGELSAAQAESIARDVVSTPGITINRVIVTKGSEIIVDLP